MTSISSFNIMMSFFLLLRLIKVLNSSTVEIDPKYPDNGFLSPKLLPMTISLSSPNESNSFSNCVFNAWNESINLTKEVGNTNSSLFKPKSMRFFTKFSFSLPSSISETTSTSSLCSSPINVNVSSV